MSGNFIGSHQSVSVTGKVIKPLQRSETSTGEVTTSIRIPVNYVYQDMNGNKKTETTWFKVHLYNKLAENALKMLKPGDYVQVIGRLTPQPIVKYDEFGESFIPNYLVVAESVSFLTNGKSKSE